MKKKTKPTPQAPKVAWRIVELDDGEIVITGSEGREVLRTGPAFQNKAPLLYIIQCANDGWRRRNEGRETQKEWYDRDVEPWMKSIEEHATQAKDAVASAEYALTMLLGQVDGLRKKNQ